MKNYYLTDEEFDTFLQSIGGLENGYFTNSAPIISRHWCSCNNGWLGLIKELIEAIIPLGWDKQSTQIKEKFGGLRFYINGATEEIWKVISKYEHKSYEVCEQCGSTEHVGSTSGGWIYTRCKECAKKENLMGWIENHKGSDDILSFDVKIPIISG